jgi:hypothetical protein
MPSADAPELSQVLNPIEVTRVVDTAHTRADYLGNFGKNASRSSP